TTHEREHCEVADTRAQRQPEPPNGHRDVLELERTAAQSRVDGKVGVATATLVGERARDDPELDRAHAGQLIADHGLQRGNQCRHATPWTRIKVWNPLLP